MENYDIYLADFIRREFGEDEDEDEEPDYDIDPKCRGFEK